MTKKIILCADDYSQNEDICEGILLLLAKQRLNAVSCLVNAPSWPETHAALHAFKTNTLIGLHLNFTFGSPLSTLWKNHYGSNFRGLMSFIKSCYSTGYLKQAITAEINAQINAFSSALGKYPDFIDGHQHIQQLPGIRDVLIELQVQNKWPGFVRNTSNGFIDMLSLTAFPKRQLIALLGGSTFKNKLNAKDIPTNTSFAGIYNFKHAPNYQKYFQRFLSQSKHGGLIMCHPGVRSHDTTDPLFQSRCHEFDYFMSSNFIQDLTSQEIVLQTTR